MADFNVRSDAINVEQIMEQIRARIREKRGVDYTEAEIRELASSRLEKFLDPRGVRSDLLEQFRQAQPPYSPPELPNFAFEDQTIFESTRGPLRLIRRLLRPILKLFFNPNPLIQALNIQSKLNAAAAEREAKRDAARYAFDQLHYEVMHNLVVETTRLGIEVKNLKMRLESLASRLEFNERRARSLESVVVYQTADEAPPARADSRSQNQGQGRRRAEAASSAPASAQPPEVPAEAGAGQDAVPADGAQATPASEGPGQRSRRRRRRRGRRGGGSAAAAMGEQGTPLPGDESGGDGDDAESADASFEGESASGPEPPADEAADQTGQGGSHGADESAAPLASRESEPPQAKPEQPAAAPAVEPSTPSGNDSPSSGAGSAASGTPNDDGGHSDPDPSAARGQ